MQRLKSRASRGLVGDVVAVRVGKGEVLLCSEPTRSVQARVVVYRRVNELTVLLSEHLNLRDLVWLRAELLEHDPTSHLLFAVDVEAADASPVDADLSRLAGVALGLGSESASPDVARVLGVLAAWEAERASGRLFVRQVEAVYARHRRLYRDLLQVRDSQDTLSAWVGQAVASLPSGADPDGGERMWQLLQQLGFAQGDESRPRRVQDMAALAAGRYAALVRDVGPGAGHIERRIWGRVLGAGWRRHLAFLEQTYQDVYRRNAGREASIARFIAVADAGFATWQTTVTTQLLGFTMTFLREALIPGGARVGD